MKTARYLVSIFLILGLFSNQTSAAQNFFQKVFGSGTGKVKKENHELRLRIMDLEEELQRYRAEARQRDSLESALEEIFEENTGDGAVGIIPEIIAPEVYTPEVTDSLLSIWYLHRQARESREDEGFNMDSVHFSTNVPDSVLIARLERMNSFITLPYNETVKNCMILYSEKMPRKMCSILGLSNYYMPIFEETFRRYGLPMELKYLAIIESGLNPRAVSRVGATGMWQFMYPTARMYGLEINSYVDDRLNPFASVDAAARYLRDAYKIFGDWSLAISSYNCGSGNVNKAIKRAGGSRDFWNIYQYLPKETRGYVPLMVGAMYALNYSKEYGLELTPVMIPSKVDTFMVHRNLHFRQISEVLGIPLSDLRNLNPQYYQDVVPGNQGEYVLRLPFQYSAEFLANEENIYSYKKDEIFNSKVDVDRYNNAASGPSVSAGGTGEWITYKVKSGDSLGKIASKHHVTVKQLQKWNNLKGTNIRAGQKLKVGRRSGYKPAESGSKDKDYTVYTVVNGDSLYKIAQKYPGVSAKDIMDFNGISENIKPGMKLKIPRK